MANVNFDDFDVGSYRRERPQGDPAFRFEQVQRALNISGAVISLALVLGLGVWGYQLAVRDVTGIPVVRALEGPMRIAPEDPGGEVAAYQGLAVNRIAAEGEAAPPADRIVLAPKPADLTQDDQPGLGGTVAMNEIAPLEPASLPGAASTDTALADPAMAYEGSIEPLADAELDPIAAEEIAQLTDLPIHAGTVMRSPRPLARPDGDLFAQAATMAVAAALAPSSPREIEASALTPGTRLVQLGAFDDADGAREEWDRLNARFGDLLADKALVLQTAESGGRSFTRLRAAGFDGEADARRFCSALLSENASCIPVALR